MISSNAKFTCVIFLHLGSIQIGRAIGKQHDITEMRSMIRVRYHRAVLHIMREEDKIRIVEMAETIGEKQKQ